LGLNSPTPVSLANIATIGMISGSLVPPYIDNLTLEVSSVPEPTSLVLGFGALASLGLFTLRKKFLRESHDADITLTP
jgi:hypothetical protein